MIPIVTPEEMARVDQSAPEPVEVLVERAGFEVATACRSMLGGTYGKRVVVVAGSGNNGADGRAAARVLRRRGAAVSVLEVKGLGPGERLPACDVVIDAAFGTGLNRAYQPPDSAGTPVLSVDIPSGVSGITGLPVDGGGAVTASRTVTFAAYKPGLLLGQGPDRAGRIELAGIGLRSLAEEIASTWLVTDLDVSTQLQPRPRESHKWKSAVLVVGGSPGMPGAALLVATAALRCGAGYALVCVPGAPPGGGLPPGEYVARDLPGRDWGEAAADHAARAGAMIVGPGLGDGAVGTHRSGESPVAQLLRRTAIPAVVDADGITALGGIGSVQGITERRNAPVVLTPHAGEFERLVGHPPGEDRIADVRRAARASGAVVLLKGSTTVVSDPEGRVLVSSSGSARLATAGTGDVLSGMIGAFLARGVPALDAAALAAHAHGRAASLGPSEGLVASDLPRLAAEWLSALAGRSR